MCKLEPDASPHLKISKHLTLRSPATIPRHLLPSFMFTTPVPLYSDQKSGTVIRNLAQRSEIWHRLQILGRNTRHKPVR
ncbi:MAG: hypothetical protein ACPHJ3_15915, partial [Rubripirellula sp.]